MEKNEQGLLGETMTFIKAHAIDLLPGVFVLLLISSCVVGLGYLGLLGSLLAACFLLLPFLFGLIKYIIDLIAAKPADPRETTRYFGRYFSLVYRGAFMAIRCMFKALGFTLAAVAFMAILYYPIASAASSEFAASIDELMRILEAGDEVTFNEFINGSNPVTQMFDIIQIALLVIGTTLLGFFVSLNVRMAVLRLLSPMDTRFASLVTGRYKSLSRKEHRPLFSINLIFWILAGSLSLMTGILCLLSGLDYRLSGILGLAVLGVLGTIYWPFFLSGSAIFTLSTPGAFLKARIEILEMSLANAETYRYADPTTTAHIRNLLEEDRKHLEEYERGKSIFDQNEDENK